MRGLAPLPIVAPSTPSDCFAAAMEAARIAITYRTPVILLSDGYLANGAEPWRLPAVEDLPSIGVDNWTDKGTFRPYLRDPVTLARPWAVPGTAGLEHRIGGLEKEGSHAGTGDISYDPANHDFMVRLRAEKVARVADDLPPLEVVGAPEGDLLVVGWGSTRGAMITSANCLPPPRC